MSDRGNGLTIIAIIIAIGAVGMGGYTIFLQPTTIIQQASGNSEITNIWTRKQESVYYTDTSYTDVSDMDLEITVAAGETVYVMFNAEFSNGPTDGNGYLYGGVRIMRDNVEIPGSERSFNIESVIGIMVSYTLTTQFIIEGLAAGKYELEVQATAQAQNGVDRVKDGLLMVYTYR